MLKRLAVTASCLLLTAGAYAQCTEEASKAYSSDKDQACSETKATAVAAKDDKAGSCSATATAVAVKDDKKGCCASKAATATTVAAKDDKAGSCTASATAVAMTDDKKGCCASKAATATAVALTDDKQCADAAKACAEAKQACADAAEACADAAKACSGEAGAAAGVVLTSATGPCGEACGDGDGGCCKTAGAATKVMTVARGEACPVALQKEPGMLAVGDNAPILAVNEFIKGSEITGLERGRAYVVEFWATWCGPCIKAIPHLTELQSEYADEGLTVIGIAASEEGQNETRSDEQVRLDLVNFVDKKGSDMGYTVAYDADGLAKKHWFKAAGLKGIPATFIVNRQGKVAWIGNPHDKQFDSTLKAVLDGTHDINAAAADFWKGKYVEAKAEPIQASMKEAYAAGEFGKVVESMDTLLGMDSDRFGGYAMQKYQIMATKMGDMAGASDYGWYLVENHLSDNADGLNSIAWITATEIDGGDLDLALQAARRAVELTDGESGYILDTLARVYYEQGDVTKALKIQRKAVECAEDNFKAELEQALEMYEKAAAKKTS